MMKRAHLSTIIGAIIAIATGYELHSLIHDTAADRPVIWAVFAVFAFGCFLMVPGLFGQFVKTVVIFAPKLSFGSRREDVPISVAPKGTKPGAPVVAPLIVATDEDPDPNAPTPYTGPTAPTLPTQPAPLDPKPGDV